MIMAWDVGLATGEDMAGNAFRVVVLFPACLLLCWSYFSGLALGLAFSWMPIRWLGNMSYSFYLIHGVTLEGLFRLFEATRNRITVLPGLWIALLTVGFLASVCTSAVLFAPVERGFSLNVSEANRRLVAA